MTNTCKYCNQEIEFDASPGAGWAHRSAWGYHYYCKGSPARERHSPITNLDIVEQLATERNLI